MEANLQFRRAVDSDFPFLLALRSESMNPYILGAGLIPSEKNHIERIQFRFDCAEIVIYNSSDVGLLKVVKEGPVWDLVQIQLSPRFRGLGIGETVIKRVLNEAFSGDVSVKLNVFKVNPAKNLYERLGFRIYLETEATFEMRASP